MSKSMLYVLCVGGLLWVLACNMESRGFALPQGSVDQGKKTFVSLNCNQCHSIADISWAGDADMGDVHFRLGGETEKKKTYGELVTSVINPSHRIARRYRTELTTASGTSKMKNYNDIMKVQELVDLVTFLQEEYEVVPTTLVQCKY